MRPSFKPNVTKLVVCERFLNVQTSKQHGKKWAVGRPPSGGGAPYQGTTGTVVNPGTVLSHVTSISRNFMIKLFSLLNFFQMITCMINCSFAYPCYYC